MVWSMHFLSNIDILKVSTLNFKGGKYTNHIDPITNRLEQVARNLLGKHLQPPDITNMTTEKRP